MGAEDRLRGRDPTDDRALHRHGHAAGPGVLILDLDVERRRRLRRTLRRSSLAAFAIAAILGFAGIFQHGLWTPDEPREAEIGREMHLQGFSALPTLGGEPFVEKPPLFPWAIAASYGLFGVSPGSARIPAALFGIGAVLVAYALGRRAGGRLAGLASALVLATSVKFAEVSHASVNDIALTFFVGCGHLAFLAARDEHRLGRRSSVLWLAGIAAGFAFLTKAWIGPILLAGPPILAAAIGREWSFLRRALVPAATAVLVGVVLVGAPWVLALGNSAGWEPVRVCLVDNALGRAVGGAGGAAFGHARGPLHYLETVPLSFLPWTLALPAAIASGALAANLRGGRTRFLAWLALAGLLLLSIPSGKRDLYALPLFPAASVIPGVWLSRAGTRARSLLDRASLVALIAVPALAWILAGVALAAAATQRVEGPAAELARALRDGDGERVLLVASALVAGAGLGIAWIAAKIASVAAPIPRIAGLAAAVLFLFTLVFHAGLRPLIDPIKDLRRGSLEIARAVPEDEPLLAFEPDETTRAVVPFYSGRILRGVDRPELALAELEAGPARHLVVIDSAEAKLSMEARRNLTRISTVHLGATRTVGVYRYEASR